MSKVGILHLSDLHIADTIYTDNKKSRLQDDSYCITLNAFISRQKVEHSIDHLYLAISGDISQSGDTGEFEEAKKVITSLCNQLSINRTDVLLVPGNHDINWVKIIERLREKNFTDRNSFHSQKELKYNEFMNFYNSFFSEEKSFSYEKSIFDVMVIEEINTIILAVNTMVHESQLKQDHYGFIDGNLLFNDLQDIAKQYKNYKKIAVMHHNPNPSGGESSSIKNWNDVIGIFEQFGVNTFLCGHTHVTDAFTETRRQSRNYLTTGSIGKSDTDLNNSFLLLTSKDNSAPILTSQYCTYISNTNVRSYWQPDTHNPNTIEEIKL